MTSWSEMTTPERATALGGLIAKNPTASATELGVSLGTSRNAVLGFIARNEGVLPEWDGTTRTAIAWTDAMVETLRTDYLNGSSRGEIAKKLGLTESTVQWKIGALGLPKRSEAALRQSYVNRTHRPAPKAKGTGLKFGKPVSDVPLLPADVDARAFEPLFIALPAPYQGPVQLKTLTQLAPLRHDGSSDECHWPVGDAMLFCACPTDGSNRYCATHAKRSGKMVPRLVLA